MKNRDRSLVIEQSYNAAADLVWKAISDAKEMKKWYFDVSEFKPEVGFEFQFYGQGHKGEKYLHLCKVTEVIPRKKLSYSWRYDNYPGISIVTFELFEGNNKTTIRLTHEGLESFPTDNPDFAEESFNEGWTYLMGKSLKEFVEK